MPRVQIRLLRTFDEFRACEDIQKEVWGTQAVGSELMGVTQKYGGVVLGALVGNKVVGFIYALLARRHRRLIHWSHMMAVREGFRDRGLGLRLKLAHRRLALAQGLRSICWTYDPLQSRNASLNLVRLGVEVEEYIPDCYGRFPSLIEKGLPSDRFVVNWRIASAMVQRHLAKGAPPAKAIAGLPRANETRFGSDGLLENTRLHLGLRTPRLLIEIPSHTDTMRSQALKLAIRWRQETRQLFQHYLAAGYRVAGFVPPSSATAGKCFYVLRCRKR
jgi:predicted GNAT superfamily acetyltransferase